MSTASETSTPRPDEGWDPTKVLAGVFGLFAGLVALVYVFGGIALLLRLQLKGLRAEVVVATLPREFLVSVGLAVLLQFIIVVAFLLVAFGPREERSAVIVLSTTFATAALAYPLMRWIGWWDWWLLLVFAAAIATWFALRLLLREILESPDKNSLRGACIVTLCAFLIFIPWRAALEWFSLEGLDVTVCTTSSESFDGLFIGENESSVYVGETGAESPRIVEIPRTEIRRVFLGKGARDITCTGYADG